MKIKDLKPLKANPNKGTNRGNIVLHNSLTELGAGRSIVVDRDNTILAGNHVAQAASSAGIHDAIVVETDGSKLVVVKRTDLSAEDPKAKALAVADNRTSELGLEWDPVNLAEIASDTDLSYFFDADELARFVVDGIEQKSSSKEIDIDSFSMEHKCPKCGFEFDDK